MRLCSITRLFSGLLLLSTLAAAQPHVLCSTFPMYQIARNVAGTNSGIKLDLLLPASLGCPHHYSLSPRDMRKLAAAEVVILNGLGMEAFLGAPLKKSHPELVWIDSAKGITNLIYDSATQSGGHGHGESCDHGHAHVNPHLFAGPRMNARLAVNIAAELGRIDPERADQYAVNAARYAAGMNRLADEMTALVRSFPNNRMVQPHGVFDYLARDIGLDIVATTQPHGQEPSAAHMLELIQTVRATGAAAIFSEPQYSSRVSETLSRETGVPTAMLDPAASGPEDAPLDYVEMVMRKNMETLRAILARPSP